MKHTPSEIEQIKAMRGEGNKPSQAEIAEACGVDQSTVSLWLNGIRNPSGSARILLRQFIAGRDKVAS